MFSAASYLKLKKFLLCLSTYIRVSMGKCPVEMLFCNGIIMLSIGSKPLWQRGRTWVVSHISMVGQTSIQYAITMSVRNTHLLFPFPFFGNEFVFIAVYMKHDYTTDQ